MKNNKTESDRMTAYAWCDTESNNEVKFSDYFVPKGTPREQASFPYLYNYMRSQFPRREKYFDSDSVLKAVWDVTDIARRHGKLYPHSHFDDIIRATIPGKIGILGCEFHNASFDSVCDAVDAFIIKNKKKTTLARYSVLPSQCGLRCPW